MGLKKEIFKIPGVRRCARFFPRLGVAFGYYRRPLSALVRWAWCAREETNYTYDLAPANKRHLAAMIAEASGRPQAEIEGYIREIDEDEELRAHVAAVVRSRGRGAITAETVMHPGRRAGWYALVRALRPRVVIETGVDKGLGSCVLAAALRRNAAEGRPGRYYGTDINPGAGYLLCGPYAEHGRILYGDSIASLRAINEPVDLFINDSDHSADYEAEEYRVIAPKLAPGAVIIGDNAHVTDRLLEFSVREGRSFLYFQEKPVGHWYPGAGIGLSFRRAGNGASAS